MISQTDMRLKVLYFAFCLLLLAMLYNIFTENMIFEPNPVEIVHNEIGKYFDQFGGNHYKLNPAKQKEYPEDTICTLGYVQRCYL